MQQQTVQPADYLIAYYVGVKQAIEDHEPDTTGSGLLFRAVKAHHRASHAINLKLDQFLVGYASGYRGYYNGVISGSEV